MANMEVDLFQEEIRHKKNQAYSNKARTGRGSSKSRKGMSTPFDFMNKAEREKLNGEVTLTNLFDVIISREEFDTMEEKQQKAMLTRWREIYPNEKIMKEMGITASSTFSKYITALDIPRKGRVNTGRPRKNPIKKTENKQALAPTAQAPEPTPIVDNFVQQPVKLITSGLHLEYNGKFSSEQINHIFTKLQLLIEGEKNDFNIELRITESEKKENKEEGQLTS
jgi:hypothetical protein